MEEADREKILAEHRKLALQRDAKVEQRNSKYNLNKIQESWLKVMRVAKTKQLKKQVEIINQNHERDVDRKDAILQMLDRDLDEAEEQHQVAVRAHLQNVDRLIAIQRARVEGLEEELQLIVQQVEAEEKSREQMDITEHQA